MELVGARLGDGTDHATGGPAVLGREVAGQGLELADRFHAQDHTRNAAGSLAHGVVDVGAVQNKAGGIGPGAVDGDLLSQAHDQAAAGRPGRDHAWLQDRQLGETAAVQGQIADLLVVDQTTDCGAGGFHQRSRACDDHLFGDCTDTHGDIHHRFLSQSEMQPSADGGLKSCQRCFHLEVSQRQLGNTILTEIVGHTGPDGVGVQMGHGDFHTRQNPSCIVLHGAQNGGCSDLSPGQRKVQSEYQKDGK